MSQGVSEMSRDSLFRNLPSGSYGFPPLQTPLHFNMEQFMAYKLAASSVLTQNKFIPQTILNNINENHYSNTPSEQYKPKDHYLEKPQEVPENLVMKSKEEPPQETLGSPCRSSPKLLEEEVLSHLKGKDLVVSRITSNDDHESVEDKSSMNVVNLSSIDRSSDAYSSAGESSRFDEDERVYPLSPENSYPQLPNILSPDIMPNQTTNLIPALLLRHINSQTRKPRGQKKPIPDDQKTPRYYERRMRNNRAAKKSRDQRKMREQLISKRVLELQAENSMLKSELLRLEEEEVILRAKLAAK